MHIGTFVWSSSLGVSKNNIKPLLKALMQEPSLAAVWHRTDSWGSDSEGTVDPDEDSQAWHRFTQWLQAVCILHAGCHFEEAQKKIRRRGRADLINVCLCPPSLVVSQPSLALTGCS